MYSKSSLYAPACAPVVILVHLTALAPVRELPALLHQGKWRAALLSNAAQPARLERAPQLSFARPLCAFRASGVN